MSSQQEQLTAKVEKQWSQAVLFSRVEPSRYGSSQKPYLKSRSLSIQHTPNVRVSTSAFPRRPGRSSRASNRSSSQRRPQTTGLEHKKQSGANSAPFDIHIPHLRTFHGNTHSNVSDDWMQAGNDAGGAKHKRSVRPISRGSHTSASTHCRPMTVSVLPREEKLQKCLSHLQRRRLFGQSSLDMRAHNWNREKWTAGASEIPPQTVLSSTTGTAIERGPSDLGTGVNVIGLSASADRKTEKILVDLPYARTVRSQSRRSLLCMTSLSQENPQRFAEHSPPQRCASAAVAQGDEEVVEADEEADERSERWREYLSDGQLLSRIRDTPDDRTRLNAQYRFLSFLHEESFSISAVEAATMSSSYGVHPKTRNLLPSFLGAVDIIEVFEALFAICDECNSLQSLALVLIADYIESSTALFDVFKAAVLFDLLPLRSLHILTAWTNARDRQQSAAQQRISELAHMLYFAGYYANAAELSLDRFSTRRNCVYEPLPPVVPRRHLHRSLWTAENVRTIPVYRSPLPPVACTSLNEYLRLVTTFVTGASDRRKGCLVEGRVGLRGMNVTSEGYTYRLEIDCLAVEEDNGIHAHAWLERVTTSSKVHFPYLGTEIVPQYLSDVDEDEAIDGAGAGDTGESDEYSSLVSTPRSAGSYAFSYYGRYDEDPHQLARGTPVEQWGSSKSSLPANSTHMRNTTAPAHSHSSKPPPRHKKKPSGTVQPANESTAAGEFAAVAMPTLPGDLKAAVGCVDRSGVLGDEEERLSTFVGAVYKASGRAGSQLSVEKSAKEKSDVRPPYIHRERLEIPFRLDAVHPSLHFIVESQGVSTVFVQDVRVVDVASDDADSGEAEREREQSAVDGGGVSPGTTAAGAVGTEGRDAEGGVSRTAAARLSPLATANARGWTASRRLDVNMASTPGFVPNVRPRKRKETALEPLSHTPEPPCSLPDATVPPEQEPKHTAAPAAPATRENTPTAQARRTAASVSAESSSDARGRKASMTRAEKANAAGRLEVRAVVDGVYDDMVSQLLGSAREYLQTVAKPRISVSAGASRDKPSYTAPPRAANRRTDGDDTVTVVRGGVLSPVRKDTQLSLSLSPSRSGTGRLQSAPTGDVLGHTRPTRFTKRMPLEDNPFGAWTLLRESEREVDNTVIVSLQSDGNSGTGNGSEGVDNGEVAIQWVSQNFARLYLNSAHMEDATDSNLLDDRSHLLHRMLNDELHGCPLALLQYGTHASDEKLWAEFLGRLRRGINSEIRVTMKFRSVGGGGGEKAERPVLCRIRGRPQYYGGALKYGVLSITEC